VASINVHGDVGEVERLESVRNTLTVAGSRVLAGLEVDVCDQVGERVRLDDQSNGSAGVLLEDSNNGCKISVYMLASHIEVRTLTVNVLALVGGNATDGKLSVGSLGGAITTGQIVDDQSGDLITRNVLDGVLDDVDLFAGVAGDPVRLPMRIQGKSTYIHIKVPMSATLVAAAARAESVMAATAALTSEE
jgi:hypothetical protein